MKGEYRIANNIVGAVTYDLLDKCALFTNTRVKKTYPMSINKFDNETFTTIKSLYECNVEIYKSFLNSKGNFAALSTSNYDEIEQEELLHYTVDFWDLFILSFPEINKFIFEGGDTFRSDPHKGNLLFRPITLYPLVHSICYINVVSGCSFVEILKQFARMNRDILNELWSGVIWNPHTRKMVMSNEKITLKIFIYLYDSALIGNIDEFKSWIQRFL
ncbi:MAG: hypothetical protein SNH27_12205 [Rikenellaceae bacterium]